MEFIRIGNKVINPFRIQRMTEKIIALRSNGLSQAEVAREMNVERTFISRLESLGEVRWGEKIALVGFPIKNKEQINELCQEAGIDYVFLLTEKERWNYIEKKSGIDLFNSVMDLIARLKEYDTIVFLGSDQRIDLVDTLLDGKVIGVKIGESPLTEDIIVELDNLKRVIDSIPE